MSGGPWAVCDRCSFRVRHYECSTEWTGLFVCRDCRDPRPPWLDSPNVDPFEGAPIRDARLDQDAVNPVFISDDAPVDPDSL